MPVQEVCLSVCVSVRRYSGETLRFSTAARVFLTEDYDFRVLVRVAVLLQPESEK